MIPGRWMLLAVGAAGLVLAASGCGSSGRDGGGAGAGGGAASQVQGPTGLGLDVRTWIVDNAGTLERVVPEAEGRRAWGRTAEEVRAEAERQRESARLRLRPPTWREALERYADRPIEADPAVLAAWRGSGLAIYAVPVDELDRLAETIGLAGRVEGRWLGEAPRWTAVARGPEVKGAVVVRTDMGPLPLRGGRPELRARAWVAPGSVADEPGSGGPGTGSGAGSDEGSVEPPRVLRVELTPALAAPAAEPEGIEAWTSPPPSVRLESGAEDAFARFALGLTLDGRDAIVIAPSDPGERRMGLEERGPRAPLGGLVGGEGSSSDEVAVGAGPLPPPMATLGELLLADRTRFGGIQRVGVVVLVPRVEGAYRLLGE